MLVNVHIHGSLDLEDGVILQSPTRFAFFSKFIFYKAINKILGTLR